MGKYAVNTHHSKEIFAPSIINLDSVLQQMLEKGQ